jgi:tryptophanyl-tRNA synthetase
MTSTLTGAPAEPVSGTLAAALRRSAEIEALIREDARAFRILTGDRPTGYLHLGHYFGTLRNRVRLQDAGAQVLVLVGQDQLPHVEVTRLIARRFNERYPGAGRVPLFPLPDALLSDAPLLLGTDGGKMSKSRGNAIELRATADETTALIRGAKTDSIRRISYDPASRPEVSSLVLLAALCLGRDRARALAEQTLSEVRGAMGMRY